MTPFIVFVTCYALFITIKLCREMVKRNKIYKDVRELIKYIERRDYTLSLVDRDEEPKDILRGCVSTYGRIITTSAKLIKNEIGE